MPHRPEAVPLRAHRPMHPDAQFQQQPHAADVQEQFVDTEDLPEQPTWLQKHLHQIGFGMLLMLVGYCLASWYIVPFVNQTLDQWHCGENRICQYDLDVGHGGTSHFITQYWNNQVIVIEFPNDDPVKTKLYSQQVTITEDTSQHLVTLTTATINKHPFPGKPDLVANVSGFAVPVIFYNTGKGFSTEAPNG